MAAFIVCLSLKTNNKKLYLFLDRGEGKEWERNINVCLPLALSAPGTWPATQACALTGNQTSDPLVHRPVLSPLSHTSQGYCVSLHGRIHLPLGVSFSSVGPKSHQASGYKDTTKLHTVGNSTGQTTFPRPLVPQHIHCKAERGGVGWVEMRKKRE